MTPTPAELPAFAVLVALIGAMGAAVAAVVAVRYRPHGGDPLADQRDRHGFATDRHLRQEASVTGARRRAAYTRPSLAAAGGRLEAPDVGYPLGRTYRRLGGGMALWPSWEASLRLVAPPGEGKTFRVLVPILRQHPGPALATSTKADLYELTR